MFNKNKTWQMPPIRATCPTMLHVINSMYVCTYVNVVNTTTTKHYNIQNKTNTT